MAERPITVVETREFQRRAASRMSDQERQDFITFIAGSPENGALMRGTGGAKAAGVLEPGVKAVEFGSFIIIMVLTFRSFY